MKLNYFGCLPAGEAGDFSFLKFADALASATCLPQAGLRKMKISPKVQNAFGIILKSFRPDTI